MFILVVCGRRYTSPAPGALQLETGTIVLQEVGDEDCVMSNLLKKVEMCFKKPLRTPGLGSRLTNTSLQIRSHNKYWDMLRRS